jgi:type I restriction enzyme R subunit
VEGPERRRGADRPQPYYDDGSGKEPRYYQRNAINAAVEAIAKGQDRVLLVMATGTGKTYTAFQIIWRLWKAGPEETHPLPGRPQHPDRPDHGQRLPPVRRGDGQALEHAAKTIERDDGSKTELPLALTTGPRQEPAHRHRLRDLPRPLPGHHRPEGRQKLFREFSPDFFDLIVIDECHRGSAAEDSAWREILEYFSLGATQIGLTATPKETEYVSNIAYFGPPVYTYSLKQGIRDGFLAPYKVVKVHLDIDVQGYRPHEGRADKRGS